MDKLLKIWSDQVERTFRSEPRNGNDSSVVWLPRTQIESQIERELTSRMHLCIDGPTGTGKSSLAITVLARLDITFLPVQLTNSMDWRTFCFEIDRAAAVVREDRRAAYEFAFGIDRGMPTVMLKSKPANGDAAPTEHDLCRNLVNNHFYLVIDDFEKASPELTTRIADTMRLMTQTFSSDGSKIVVIGTDDIYKRIAQSDLGLRDRISQVTVGTLDDKSHGWRLLLDGFERLRISHPAKLHAKYPWEVTKDHLVDCQRHVYVAADNLPKALNRLGRQMCLKVNPESRRITVTELLGACREMTAENRRTYDSEITQILQHAEGNEVTKAVLMTICRKGVGRIYNLTELINMMPAYYHDRIEEAIHDLVSMRVLIRTGAKNEVIMVKDPHLAHVFAQTVLTSSGAQVTIRLTPADDATPE